MGSGASTQAHSDHELTSDQKVALTKMLEEKYLDLKKEEVDEKIVYHSLRLTYEEGKQAILGQTAALGSTSSNGIKPSEVDQTVDDEDEEEGDENEFALKGSVIYQPFNSTDNLRVLSSKSKKNVAVDQPGLLVRARTSSQLIDMAKESVQDDQQKIAEFIKQIKSGEKLTQTTSEFRTRRLTYSAKTEDDVPAPTNLVYKNTPPAVTTSRKSTIRVARTTIFASSEIGSVTEKAPPFPDTVLGTYSCHGIEPAHDEEEGVHEKINQDRACVVCPYNSQRNEALFMVLDGHGSEGDKVSEFVMRQIVVSLEKDVMLNIDPVAALKNTFVQTNAALLVTKINYVTSGCTAVAVYVKDQKLYVANVGDSRAVMAYKPSATEIDALKLAAEMQEHPEEPQEGDLPIEERFLARDMSRDHKPDDPEEMARITAWGGYVCPPAESGLSARVYLDPGFTMIGLAMARSIGDHAVKAVGVIPEPEVKTFDLQESDQFMIMASDGVWEFITSQEAVDIVQRHLHRGYHEACQELIETAAARWQEEEGDYRDDITAIVVKFPLPYNMG